MTDNDLEFEKNGLKFSDLEWDFRLGGLKIISRKEGVYEKFCTPIGGSTKNNKMALMSSCR